MIRSLHHRSYWQRHQKTNRSTFEANKIAHDKLDVQHQLYQTQRTLTKIFHPYPYPIHIHQKHDIYSSWGYNTPHRRNTSLLNTVYRQWNSGIKELFTNVILIAITQPHSVYRQKAQHNNASQSQSNTQHVSRNKQAHLYILAVLKITYELSHNSFHNSLL